VKSWRNCFAKKATLWIVSSPVTLPSLRLNLAPADDRLFPTKSFASVDYSTANKSDVQGYWDSNTCNTKWNFPGIEKGTKRYYEATRMRKYEIEPHIPEFAEFQRWKGKRVLEVGGGFCTTALDFALAGAILTVVDMSTVSLQLCRERFIAYNPEFNNTVRFVAADAEILSTVLKDDIGTFDLVWSFGVIHHSPQPQKSMNEFAKLVKPGGEVKVMVYALVSFKLFWVQNATKQYDMSQARTLLGHYSEAVPGSPCSHTFTIRQVLFSLHLVLLKECFCISCFPLGGCFGN
jgi:ubiquinone/menaquinone biosynthesis C-methylase UbiE